MPADSNRDIARSIYGRVSVLFSSPPSGSSLNAYTVYNESDLRQAQAKTLAVDRPCVFITDAPLRPVDTSLPLIAIQVETFSMPFELGNEFGMTFQAMLHCFGRQRGEASLIASFLQRNFRPLTIYDYSDPTAPVTREVALMNPSIKVEPGPRLTDSEHQEGAFDFWYIVSFSGAIRDN